MRKRLWVTGCGGFVAGAVAHEASTSWDLHALSRGEPLLSRENLVWHTLDLLDTERLRALFHEVRPNAVIHAAALANIDFCEANPGQAWRVNEGATRTLADLCDETGARMIYVSTDTVFDGVKGHYAEDDAPGPVNEYARTKVAGEQCVG